MAKVNESPESIAKFKQMYLDNIPNKEIGEYFGIKSNTVCYWVKKLGIPMRGSGRNNIFENPFLEDCPERDYWLGYLFADGHIQRSHIEFSSIDYDAIEAFNKFTGNICKIYSETYTTQAGEVKTLYRAKIISTTLGEWFMNQYNISTVKHHNLDPNIEINWDIFKGYFDGDGSAHRIRGFTMTSCSKVWIDRLAKFITDNTGVIPKINQYLDCYKVCVWDKNDLAKVVPLIYQHDTFCLQRKKVKFEPFLSNGVSKQGELLKVCDDNQQLSQELTGLESSETNS